MWTLIAMLVLVAWLFLCGWCLVLGIRGLVRFVAKERKPRKDPYAGPEDPFSRTNGGWDF